MSNSRNLVQDHQHYSRSFQAFAKATAKYEILTEWVDNVFTEMVVDKLQVKIPEGTPFRALGVGSGSGGMETDMTFKLLNHYPIIRNCVVEPSGVHLTQYQDLVRKRANKLKGVTYDWRQQGLEEFEESRRVAKNLTKFHFISVIHSLYHLQDWEESLRWLFDQVEDGGVLLVHINSDDSGLSKLHKRFPHLQDSLMMRYINSGHVCDVFTKNTIPFTCKTQPSPMDLTMCFEVGNPDGQLTMDFLTTTIDFHKTANPEFRREFMEFLGGPECSERNDGSVVSSIDFDAIIATKEPSI